MSFKEDYTSTLGRQVIARLGLNACASQGINDVGLRLVSKKTVPDLHNDIPGDNASEEVATRYEAGSNPPEKKLLSGALTLGFGLPRIDRCMG